jgi:hypothetical protein
MFGQRQPQEAHAWVLCAFISKRAHSLMCAVDNTPAHVGYLNEANIAIHIAKHGKCLFVHKDREAYRCAQSCIMHTQSLHFLTFSWFNCIFFERRVLCGLSLPCSPGHGALHLLIYFGQRPTNVRSLLLL